MLKSDIFIENYFENKLLFVRVLQCTFGEFLKLQMFLENSWKVESWDNTLGSYSGAVTGTWIV